MSWCHGVNARSHLLQEAVARSPGRDRVAQYRSRCNTLCDAPRPHSRARGGGGKKIRAWKKFSLGVGVPGLPRENNVVAWYQEFFFYPPPLSRAPTQVPVHTGPPMYSVLSK